MNDSVLVAGVDFKIVKKVTQSKQSSYQSEIQNYTGTAWQTHSRQVIRDSELLGVDTWHSALGIVSVPACTVVPSQTHTQSVKKADSIQTGYQTFRTLWGRHFLAPDCSSIPTHTHTQSTAQLVH